MLPHVCDGLSVLWIAALCPFWRPCIGRPVHRELMRNELCNLTTIVPATACHQRNYVKPYSRYKKAGWYTVLADPRMPATSTLLDQAHNAIERKLFAMKGFHHPGGSQRAFLTGLAHLYNLVPYQRRAQHAGQCGVEVEGGPVPTRDWLLNLPILTSGGFR